MKELLEEIKKENGPAARQGQSAEVIWFMRGQEALAERLLDELAAGNFEGGVSAGGRAPKPDLDILYSLLEDAIAEENGEHNRNIPVDNKAYLGGVADGIDACIKALKRAIRKGDLE